MSTNNYYYTSDDPLVEKFKDEVNNTEFSNFLKEVQDYLQERYNCTFTQLISQINYPDQALAEFWDEQRKSGAEVDKVVDDIFFEIDCDKRRKDILLSRY